MKLYQKIDPAFTAEFWTMIEAANHIIITTHISPDDDAIGSLLAMYQLIRQQDPARATRVTMVVSGEPVTRFASFPDFAAIRFVPDLANELGGVDLLLMLDGSQRYRFTSQPEAVNNFPGKTICLDHHASPPESFDLALIDPSQPATATIIYHLFTTETRIDKTIAEYLLLGVLGDTGNFSYLKPGQSQALEVAKDLLDITGVEISAFQSQYRAIPPRVFSLIQELVKNTAFQQTGDWPAWQSSYIPRALANSGHYTDNELSEAKHIYLGHYIKNVKGYSWGLVLTPDANGEVSISGRSLPGSVNVRLIMEQAQLGGGHDRAAGGTFKVENNEPLESEACLKKVEEWLKKNDPQQPK